jgi:hypothetical protein
MKETFVIEEKKKKTSLPNPAHLLKSHLLKEKQTLVEGNVRIEIKKLSAEDLKEVMELMERCGAGMNRKELLTIIKQGFSFGAYIERRLVAVGFAELVIFDEKTGEIYNSNESGEANALLLHEPLIPIIYEGKGIASELIDEREKEGKRKGLNYVVAELNSFLPVSDIETFVKEHGSHLDKLYLKKQYSFLPTESGGIVYKLLNV